MNDNDDEVFKTTLAAALAALAKLTPEPSTSIRQLILCLRPDIRAKRAAGATWPAIAKTLEEADIQIKPETLRAYVNGKGAPSKAARSVTEKAHKASTRIVRAAEPPAPNEVEPGFGATEATAEGKPVKSRRMK
jgi:hypothetical protein